MKLIVVGIDTREDNQLLVDHAARFARAFGSELVLVHIAEPEPTFMPWDGDLPEMRQQRAEIDRGEHRTVQHLADQLRDQGLQVRALQFRAPTADGIVDEARDLHADLILVGTHQRGPLMRALLGSVSHRVIDQASCPVMVVPRPA